MPGLMNTYAPKTEGTMAVASTLKRISGIELRRWFLQWFIQGFGLMV